MEYTGQGGERRPELDGATYVDCGNKPALTPTAAISCTCWLQVASFTKTYETILAKGDDSYRLGRGGGGTGDALHFAISGANNFDGTTVVTDNEWHFVAGTYDGTTATLYVDGKVDTARAFAAGLTASTYKLFIGENAQATGRQLTGVLDDVRIYGRGLSAGEVASLAGITKPMHKPF